MNRFCCKFAEVVYVESRWNGQLWWSGGQSSRSHTHRN